MEPTQTYKLLHSKGYHKQNENTTCELGEIICKKCNQQGLNFQNIQKAHITWYIFKKLNQKRGRRTKQTFLQRRRTDGQQTHEKMLNIIISREMQIKTTVRYHLTLVRKVIIKKSINNKCWRRCGEKETLLHCC